MNTIILTYRDGTLGKLGTDIERHVFSYENVLYFFAIFMADYALLKICESCNMTL
jgi:hypothetical protein